jgi:hypothetical protein
MHLEEGCYKIFAYLLKNCEVTVIQNLGIGIFAPKYLELECD